MAGPRVRHRAGRRRAGTPLGFQIHTVIGMLLVALFPYTRLVHAFAAPVGYLFRPYVVHRSRATPRRPGTTTRLGAGRGWTRPPRRVRIG